MKNLNQKAAELGYYNPETLTNEIKSNLLYPQYFKGFIEKFEKNNKIDDCVKFLNGGWYFRLEESEGKYTFSDWSEFLVNFEDFEFPLSLRQSKGKYYFHLPHNLVNNLKFKVPNFLYEKNAKDLKEPNMIGVFSDNKIKDWKKYCFDYFIVLKLAKAEAEKKKKDVLKEIEDIKNSITCKKTIRGKNPIWIETEYFDIKIELLSEGTELFKTSTYKKTFEDSIKIINKLG